VGCANDTLRKIEADRLRPSRQPAEQLADFDRNCQTTPVAPAPSQDVGAADDATAVPLIQGRAA
jgi:hypothetical protein